MEVQCLAVGEGRAVVDPAGATTIADDILDDFDGLAGVPALGKPVPGPGTPD
jgi:hypothetical protein